MKKMIGLLLFILFFTAACGRGNDPLVVCVSGTGLAVARVNGIDIIADDVRLHLSQAELEVTQMHGIKLAVQNTDEFNRLVREEAVGMAVFQTILRDYARRLGVALNDEQQATVRQHIENLIFAVGQDAFYDILEQQGFRDEAHLAQLLSYSFLFENIQAHVITNPVEFARFERFMPEEIDMSTHLLGAKHILSVFDPEQTDEEIRAFTEEILARALAGEDFSTLVVQYGQDPGMFMFPQGYSFGPGDMDPAFEQATRELEIGGITGPVRTARGYHIIKRVEPNEEDWYALTQRPPRTPETRMMEAVLLGIQDEAENAVIEFLAALDDL